jgi:hypothetical protein
VRIASMSTSGRDPLPRKPLAPERSASNTYSSTSPTRYAGSGFDNMSATAINAALIDQAIAQLEPGLAL